MVAFESGYHFSFEGTKMKNLITISFAVMLTACASSTLTYKPVAYDKSDSFALNIANQTELVSGNSLLRDFTREEVEEGEDRLNKSAGGLSIGLGALNLLSGNLLGVIDIAGGTAAKIATSNHISADSRWIVLMNKNEYSTPLLAQSEMLKQIRSATKKVLARHGDVGVKSVNNAETLTLNGVNLGGTLVKTLVGKDNMLDINSYQGVEGKDYYGYGFGGGQQLVFPVSPLIYNAKNQNNSIDYSSLMLEITNELPENYFIYIPSYSSLLGGESGEYLRYHDVTIKVPTIYTEGKAYQFIKPDPKKS